MFLFRTGFVVATALFVTSCSVTEQAYYHDAPVKVLSERCDDAYPHTCYSEVQRSSGETFEVNSSEIEYRSKVGF
ncbi:MAG: hypothetical protein F6K24_10225 [Okeania sp. SIO2D1]|nr:hypothetical protein [Okeania sp. SIO2D1]